MHANGFPPHAYLGLLNKIADNFQVNTPLLRSFWLDIPKTPIKNWELLADDFIEYMFDQEQVNNIGIGHSIGGTLLLYTAIRKPELFSKIILLDPVLFSPFKCYAWNLINKIGLGLYFHPLAKKALNRKKTFKSKEDIFDRYRRKKIFENFSNKSLNIYIDSIIKQHTDSVQLNFSTKIESDIYLSGLTLEKFIMDNLHNLKSKVHIMYADKDTTISKSIMNSISKNSLIEFKKMDGLSHLFPMEDSDRVYSNIKKILI